MNIFETNHIDSNYRPSSVSKLLIDLEQISDISESVLPSPDEENKRSVYRVHMKNCNCYLLNVEQGERLIVAWKNFKTQEYNRRGY